MQEEWCEQKCKGSREYREGTGNSLPGVWWGVKGEVLSGWDGSGYQAGMFGYHPTGSGEPEQG